MAHRKRARGEGTGERKACTCFAPCLHLLHSEPVAAHALLVGGDDVRAAQRWILGVRRQHALVALALLLETDAARLHRLYLLLLLDLRHPAPCLVVSDDVLRN